MFNITAYLIVASTGESANTFLIKGIGDSQKEYNKQKKGQWYQLGVYSTPPSMSYCLQF